MSLKPRMDADDMASGDLAPPEPQISNLWQLSPYPFANSSSIIGLISAGV